MEAQAEVLQVLDIVLPQVEALQAQVIVLLHQQVLAIVLLQGEALLAQGTVLLQVEAQQVLDIVPLHQQVLAIVLPQVEALQALDIVLNQVVEVLMALVMEHHKPLLFLHMVGEALGLALEEAQHLLDTVLHQVEVQHLQVMEPHQGEVQHLQVMVPHQEEVQHFQLMEPHQGEVQHQVMEPHQEEVQHLQVMELHQVVVHPQQVIDLPLVAVLLPQDTVLPQVEVQLAQVMDHHKHLHSPHMEVVVEDRVVDRFQKNNVVKCQKLSLSMSQDNNVKLYKSKFLNKIVNKPQGKVVDRCQERAATVFLSKFQFSKEKENKEQFVRLLILVLMVVLEGAVAVEEDF